jgi:plastocyanin
VTTFKGSYDRTYNPFANPTGQVWRIVPADQVPEGAVTPSAGPTGTATPGAATGTPSATGTVTATVEATSTTTSEAAASATSAATASATSAATGTARSAATGTSTPAASGTGTGTPTACTGTPSATPSATSAATAAATASARAAATSGAGGSNAAIQLSARDIKFCTDEITVKAGQEVVIEFTNNDEVAHNFALYKDATAKDLIFRGDLVTGPDKSITYTFKALAQPGTYFFRCDPHATIMFGNFNVQ